MTTGTTTWSPMSRISRDADPAGLSLSLELLRELGLVPLAHSLILPSKSLLTAETVLAMEDGLPELTRPSFPWEDRWCNLTTPTLLMMTVASTTATPTPRPPSPHTEMLLP